MHDIHTHLYWDTYDTDRDAVLARAQAAGVENILVVGCTVEESQQCVELAEKYPALYASVGIHPHEFRTLDDVKDLAVDIEALRECAKKSRKVIAIGECGLDYFVRPTVIDSQQSFVGRGAAVISDETKAAQRQGFLAQIELAKEMDVPLIVHCRDAYAEMLEILAHAGKDLRTIILHCYMGNTEVTQRFLTLPNVFFSFTGNITYPVKKTAVGTKDDLHETVKLIPLARLFVETDCPFLAPQEKRGERNEPAFVIAIGEALCRLKGVSLSKLSAALDQNFKKVFFRLS